jgi:hypothetical protein
MEKEQEPLKTEKERLGDEIQKGEHDNSPNS